MRIIATVTLEDTCQTCVFTSGSEPYACLMFCRQDSGRYVAHKSQLTATRPQMIFIAYVKYSMCRRSMLASTYLAFVLSKVQVTRSVQLP